jgi:SAM-dependent methyltransferase
LRYNGLGGGGRGRAGNSAPWPSPYKNLTDAMPDWGEIFANPEMQRLPPNPEVMALLPELKARGVRLVLDAGCGAGRHLVPLVAAGFRVLGVDRERTVLRELGLQLRSLQDAAWLAQGDLKSLPLPGGIFAFALSVNVINHGHASDFEAYCRELNRVLRPGGFLFISVSPSKFADLVRLPETVELEPGTLVKIATPDGDLVHHFPTPESLAAQFPGYNVLRLKTVPTPIPFMGGKEMPQLVFLGEKAG